VKVDDIKKETRKDRKGSWEFAEYSVEKE